MALLSSLSALEWALLLFNLVFIAFAARFLARRIKSKLSEVEQRQQVQTASRSSSDGSESE